MSDMDKIMLDGSQIDVVDSGARQPTFSEASSRTNIASGESLSTLFGKIKKWFSDLKAVAFSGSYDDLSNKPTIPSVGNGTLTIQKNGTNVATFTANQSGNETANISVPTKTSDLANDSGFVDATTGTKTTITSNNSNVDMGSYSWFIIKGGVCYVQLGIIISADDNQFVSTNLPASAFGNYLYLQNVNCDVRVDGAGNLRVTRYNSDGGFKAFQFSYPVSN